MNTKFYVLLLQILAARGITVKVPDGHTIHFKVKNQLRYSYRPFEVYCGLTDIIIISAPIVASNESLYYLTQPNGKTYKLNLTHPKLEPKNNVSYVNSYSNIEVRVIHNFSVIVPEYKHDVFNVNDGATLNSTFAFDEYLAKNEGSDFMIGPIDETYHGNWDLDVYFKNKDGDWIEVSQTFTVLIMEMIPLSTGGSAIDSTAICGSDLILQFAYPITELQTCELHAPKSTFDRFYDRIDLDLNKCSYLVKNLTMQDSGFWRVVGVGRIIYEASMYLSVKNSTDYKLLKRLSKSKIKHRRREP